MSKISDAELWALLAADQIAFTQQCYNTIMPSHQYEDNWHVHAIIEYLQAMERGEVRRLIINMPPRSLKSICVSISWAAWLLGQNPSTQIIAASYGNKLAIRQSVDTRLILNSQWYRKTFPGTRIARDQNEKQMFQTTARGHRKATSVGGAIIGDGGDYLIMDDLLKPDEAVSDIIRTGTNNWIDQSFLTRENDPKTSRIVLVMQRVHEDDPTGHLLERGGWEQLILPAYFDKRTIVEISNKRWVCEEDTYLHEARLGAAELDAKLTELKLQGFTGQYLQRPTPEGGGEFKAADIQYYNNFSKKFTCEGMNIYILYDPANTKKTKDRKDPDYTAIVVIGLASDNNYYILDLLRDRLNPTERIHKLINIHKKWNQRSGKPPAVAVEQYGMMTDMFYLETAQNELNYRFLTVMVGGQLSKEDRIRKTIPLFENKRVYFPQQILYDDIDGVQHNLVEDFIKDEMLVFPVGKHDDLLDAFARIMDEKLTTNFPELGVTYLKGGQTLKDMADDDFVDDDFMTW